MKSLKLFLCGFLMGTADIIPGVSGGTMAFITGIYDELVHSIKQWARPSTILTLLNPKSYGFKFMPFINPLDPGISDVIDIDESKISEEFKKLNIGFLIPIACGILLAIVLLSQILESLLQSHPTHVSAVFFGLVAASVLVVRKQVSQWNAANAFVCLAAAAGSFVLVGLTPSQTPEHPLFLVLCGAIAICAMILPGISGAFILLLLGKYEFILRAVNERDLFSIACIGLGCIVGLALFSHLLSWLLKEHHNKTIAVLTGFLIGSLRVLWPFAEGSVDVSHVSLIGLMFVGAVVVLGIDTFSGKK